MPLVSDSMVDRRLMESSPGSGPSREPGTLRGGVGGEDLEEKSVGRNAAGTYNGPLGGRSWRFCKGSGWLARGDSGELLAEGAGEGWMTRLELRTVAMMSF